MRQAKSQSGFTLIEILLVIGVIAILAIAAFVIFPQVQTSSRANTEREHITAITAGIKQIYGTSSYNGLNNDTVNMARVFPADMNDNNYSAGQAIKAIWSGTVDVSPGSGVNPKTFIITYRAVPSAICTKLATSIVQSFEKVSVGATVVKTVLDVPAIKPDPAVIVTACASASSIDVSVETL
jgi:prepilin-type N-terminal cleavage/methylation domain-containing protein